MYKCFFYFITCLFFSSCAITIPGEKLPKHTYNEILQDAEPPSIEYELSILAPISSKGIKQAKIGIQEYINRVFHKSKAFKRIYSGSGFEKYHFDMRITAKENFEIAFFTGVFCFFSLTLFPYYSHLEYTLNIDVKFNDQLLKSYEYRESSTKWVQFFLIFVSPFYPSQQLEDESFENLFLNFVYDLQKDKIFQKNYEK